MSDLVFSQILNRWLSTGRYTAAELAEAGNCSVDMIYKIRNEERDPSFGLVQRISRYASDTRGDNDVAYLLFVPAFCVTEREGGTADGDLNPETSAMVEAMGEMHRAAREGNPHRYAQAHRRARAALADFEAEQDRLAAHLHPVGGDGSPHRG